MTIKNVVLIGNDIRDEINLLNDKMPSALKVNEVLFQPEEVSRSIEGFIINLLQGMIFVIIVVLIGMGIRNAMVVSIAIPLSITMTIIAMKLIGPRYTTNVNSSTYYCTRNAGG